MRRAVRDVLPRVSETLEKAEVNGEDAGRQYARAVIVDLVREYVDGLALAGRPAPSIDQEEELARAVYDEMFGLGRLQPLVDDPDVENIDVNRYDQVWVTYADGRKVPGPLAADSDEELVELIRRFGAYHGHTARDFSVATPVLHLALSDRSRLAAAQGVTPHPCMSIRRHRMLEATMDDLVATGTMDRGVREFLRAVVRAPMNVVIVGGMDSGKSTLERAMIGDADPDERILTIENERELYLHLLTDRHRDVVSMEARTGNSEGAGAVTVRRLIDDALRFNARRILVGEVRGDELISMLVAMNSGRRGSICTMHADSAEEVFPRMQILADPMPAEALFRLVGRAVDFIVHLRHDVCHDPAAPVNRRYVSEIYEVLPPADSIEPAVNRVYVPGPDGRAVPNTVPHRMPKLVEAGFDPALFTARGGGLWS
jgi:Flp pilus assembly CpaF family ATPase